MRFCLVTLLAIVLLSAQDLFASYRDWDDSELASKEEVQGVLKNLEKEAKKDSSQSSFLYFTKGLSDFQTQNFESAILNFQNSLMQNDFLLSHYAHYFLGLSYFKNNQLSEAYNEFEKNVYNQKIGPKKLSALFRMGEISLKKGDLKRADQNFHLLERRTRHTAKYPLVLWNLARTNILQKNIFQGCQFIRKLYSKYPTHEIVADWGIDLRTAQVDELRPGCIATLNEQKQRIRNLQYGGESARAKKEIMNLYQNTNVLTRYYVDIILARFLIDEGDVEDGLKVLLPYYENMKNDIAYLMLLAKGATRKGDNALAVSLFLKVYKMKPKSSVGKEALFQSAFVSYLNQDYDGALSRFSQYGDAFGGVNRLTASWYISWIHYLKGDYQIAYNMFNSFSKMRMPRRVRQRLFDNLKLSYWKGVTLLKMGNVAEAKRQFEKLAQDPVNNYYSILARARLEKHQAELNERRVASTPALKGPLDSGLVLDPISLISSQPYLPEDSQTDIAPPVASDSENEEEILEDIKGSGIVDSIDGGEDDPLAQSAPEDIDDGNSENAFSSLKDPRLFLGFQKSDMLRALGFTDWANSELQYVESHTQNKSYQKMLIEKYESTNIYSRSSYIAEIYYDKERRKSFEATNIGWGEAYPKAYESSVIKHSKEFEVSPSLVWSIMRTESLYKPQAKSSVGAIGLMQVMPYTADKILGFIKDKTFNHKDLSDPDLNIQIGTKYIQRLSKMFDGYIPLIASGYNAGPHRVYSWMRGFGGRSLDEFIEHIPYNQTRGYAKKVFRNYYIYNALYFPKETQKKSIQWIVEAPKITYRGPIQMKEDWSLIE